MLAENLSYVPPDAIFALTTSYNADSFPEKVNLGQGTYKDEDGKPYILPSVVLAKDKIAGSNHEYLPILGLPAFRKLAVELVIGTDSPVIAEKRVCATVLSACSFLHVTEPYRWLVPNLFREPGLCTLWLPSYA
jgi:aspartate aminotransferase